MLIEIDIIPDYKPGIGFKIAHNAIAGLSFELGRLSHKISVDLVLEVVDWNTMVIELTDEKAAVVLMIDFAKHRPRVKDESDFHRR